MSAGYLSKAEVEKLVAERQQAIDALDGLLWVALRNGSSENDPHVIRAREVLRVKP